jgi:hypothetical protein
MNQPLTIPTTPLEHPAMDFAFLRAEGIRHLERMAGGLWTDFNTHDPGITILEQVCFALTDLGYRISYGMPDLLSEGGQSTYDSLFSPARILPSDPVTLSDTRKMLIDIAGVKNAWIERVDEPDMPLYYYPAEHALGLEADALAGEPVYLKGLHRVMIEVSDLVYTDAPGQIEDVRKEVVRRLHAHRGLCEDFESIQVLPPQDVKVSAFVEIDAVDDAEKILLGIFQRVADHISPRVGFYTLRQMFDGGKRVDEIFDGPLLEHGFIDPEELQQAQRRTEIRTSDLIREIMDVPGVRAVRNITVSAGENLENWVLRLDANQARAPKLDLEACNIVMVRNGIPVSVDVNRVIGTYFLNLRQSSDFRLRESSDRDIKPTTGRNRDVATYPSIQHQFPATYGIGEMGLPESASPERKAQAQQLKAYLMFFDQLLANYFAQLGHVRNLFSFAEPTPATYFSRMIEDPTLGIDEIRKKEPAEHRARLQQITEDASGSTNSESNGVGRRHRFLNHLLSRFAEHFTDYSLVLYGAMPDAGVSASQKIITDKQAFLRTYPQTSCARGRGFDLLKPAMGANVSVLEQRIQRKLGLVAAEDEFFFLIEHILLRPMAEDNNQLIPLLADARSRDPYSLQLSFVFPDSPHRFKAEQENFRRFVGRTIREETPAHLIPYIYWLDRAALEAFQYEFQDWLQKRRSYWTNQLGV